MEFVETVRSHRSRGEEDALKQAIQECIEQGILAEYLTRRGSEVYNMLVAEYDYELDIKTQRAEAKEEGKEEGREVTLVSMFISQMKKGKSSFEIADIFDMSMEEVNCYTDIISRFAPDYDVDAIVKFIMNNRE